jgi:hypothetical protein
MKFKTLLLLCTIPAAAFAALPFTFQSGGVISASEMNSNFQALEARIAALEASKSSSAVPLKYITGSTNGPNGTKVLRNDTTSLIEIISLDEALLGQTPVTSGHRITCDAGGTFFKSYIPPACTLHAGQAGASFYTLVYR